MSNTKSSTKPKRTRGPDKKPRKRRTDGMKPPPNYPGRNRGSGLPRNAVGALRAVRRRIPDDATDYEREAAETAFHKIVDALNGKISTVRARTRTVDADTGEVIDEGETVTVQSPALILQLARAVREDVCTPHVQNVNLTGQLAISDKIREARLRSRKEADEDE